jgi:hypothetical protein
LSNAANAEARSIVAADEEGGVVEDVAGEIMRGETKGPKGTYQVQKLLKKEEITLPKDRQRPKRVAIRWLVRWQGYRTASWQFEMGQGHGKPGIRFLSSGGEQMPASKWDELQNAYEKGLGGGAASDNEEIDSDGGGA